MKRNERIQSEQSDLTTQPFKSTNIKVCSELEECHYSKM